MVNAYILYYKWLVLAQVIFPWGCSSVSLSIDFRVFSTLHSTISPGLNCPLFPLTWGSLWTEIQIRHKQAHCWMPSLLRLILPFKNNYADTFTQKRFLLSGNAHPLGPSLLYLVFTSVYILFNTQINPFQCIVSRHESTYSGDILDGVIEAILLRGKAIVSLGRLR